MESCPSGLWCGSRKSVQANYLPRVRIPHSPDLIMSNIKILDCTLRDGGYVNNWDFDINTTLSVISLLKCAKVDYIETGFINKAQESRGTLFASISDVSNKLSDLPAHNNLLAMIKADKVPIESIPDSKYSKIKLIRLIFKKNKLDFGLNYAKNLVNKGYKVFINPTFCTCYTDYELINLVQEVNSICPFAFSLVDSMGALYPSRIKQIFEILNNNLNKNIALCFHFHNNMQLAYLNVMEILKHKTNREIILDSTVFGIGRGAGNLQTELTLKYLNENFGANYNLLPVFKIIKNYILPIKNKTKWGSSIPYFLSAINKCHPYYGRFLDTNAKINAFKINSILKSIPKDKKIYYDSSCISTLFSLMMK